MPDGFSIKYGALEAPIPVIFGEMGQQLDAFIRSNRDQIDKSLLDVGAMLFRGFAVTSAETFGDLGEALGGQKLEHLYGSTPRTAVGNRVFTASEYPADQEIPLHSEHSYQLDWPLRLMFWCAKPAASGGQTPVADLRGVTRSISRPLLEKFSRLGVQYVRNYRKGFDIPWQKVFNTEDRASVEAICAEREIVCEWSSSGDLRTTQLCQGLAKHLTTGEEVFFNQAHLFHVSALGKQYASMLIEMFGLKGLPRHARFGDGTEIEDAELAEVRAAFATNLIEFPWREFDVLLVDNMRMAHGRRPFKGERAVYALLLDGYRNDWKPAA